MSGINKAIIVGNLGQDPEVRFMPSGDAVANISVATSETWKDKQTGEQKEKTEWHRVSIFGKLAEIAGEYLKKGSKVYIEGKLQTRKWTNSDGNDQYTTEIVLQGFGGVMQMLDGKSSTNVQQSQQGQQNNQQNNQQSNGGYQQQGGNSNQGQQQQNNGSQQTQEQQWKQSSQQQRQQPQQQQTQGYQQNNQQQGQQQQQGYANQGQQQGQQVVPDDIPF